MWKWNFKLIFSLRRESGRERLIRNTRKYRKKMTSFFSSFFPNRFFFHIFAESVYADQNRVLYEVINVIENLSNYFMKGYYIFRQESWFCKILFPYSYGFVWILKIQWSSNNTSFTNSEVFMVFTEEFKVPERTEDPFFITFLHCGAGNERLKSEEFRKWAMVLY